ncbi:multidrug effflux MFS transporter [Actinoplanes sp. NPDC051861]|uniref:multidrug effflux MFS transporter n=1 Tax=Actinoplanes sp. NPDC051861 TaxID=3155170 RepID=UPI0034471C40
MTATVTWPLLIVLASLTAVAPVATDLYLPGFPAIGAELGANASGVQLTLTTFLVGLALGQLAMGPLSDRYGRRAPLIAGTALCALAGVVCAVAPSLSVLVGARFVQGFAGAAGMVIGRAVISDLVEGRAAARAFTLLVTVGGVAPVLAPLVGGLLSGPVGWRGMLWVVALLCALMVVGVVLVVPETRLGDISEKSPPGVTGDISEMSPARAVASARGFWPPVAVFALSFGVMMAYIAASPFLYQDVMGLSEIEYGLAFGVNAAGLITAGAVAGRLVSRFHPALMILWCVAVQVASTVLFLALAVSGAPPWTFAVVIFAAVTCNGGIMGNSAALAMEPVRAVAGTGSAILGFCQFAVGALVSPLVGLGGSGSATVPALVMALCSLGGGLAASRQSSSSTATATS